MPGSRARCRFTVRAMPLDCTERTQDGRSNGLPRSASRFDTLWTVRTNTSHVSDPESRADTHALRAVDTQMATALSHRSMAVPTASPRGARAWTSPRNASWSPRSPAPRVARVVRAACERRSRAGSPTSIPIVTARASGAIVRGCRRQPAHRLRHRYRGAERRDTPHPRWSPPIATQLELDTHTCFHVTANEPYIELAERLNALAPGDASEEDDVRELHGRGGRRERGEDRAQGHRAPARSSPSITRSTGAP